MSAAHLLRHSRKQFPVTFQSALLQLRSLHNALDCERSGLVRYFSTASGSFPTKGNVLLVSTGAEKRIGGARFPQRKQPGKELETSKVSLGLNGSYTCRRSPNNFIPNTITGLNGSLSCGQIASARSFSSSADLPPHQEIGMPSLSPTMTEKGGRKEALAAPGLSYTDVPNAQIRKVTANRLLSSKQTIPHYYLTVDTRVDNLIKLRGELNPLQESSGGKKISINDLVIKAAALALRKVPQCNSSWMNDFIRQYHNVNINVAVQTEHGLFVPVIRDADKKGLGMIAEEVKQLAQRARDNSLKPDDYEGGTFTISNLGGPFGIKQFCAIINPPQSAILAIGSAERRVIPGSANGQYEFGSFMSATMSCDHRVIDGAIGAEFLKAFKGYIENPTSMLL
uniref:2-oxoacid dehydrogenase acyltransferase catalytic domain-containing protein n=1 Tax=Oryza glaberrima TaxID=4538 RepID=I1QA27_ORYGL